MQKVLFLSDKSIELISSGSEDFPFVTKQVLWTDMDGMTELAKRLSSDASVCIVVDFIDESQLVQWVPKLYLWEKVSYEKNLMNKLSSEGAFFSDIRWLRRYRQTGDGRTEQLNIVTRILDTDGLVQLFDRLERFHVPVQTLYSYTALLEKLFFKDWAPRLGIRKSQQTLPLMLIVQESSHRFRQLFFVNGRLGIGRRIELESQLVGVEVGQYLLKEVMASIRYFYEQSILPDLFPGMVYLGESDMEGRELAQQYRKSVLPPDHSLEAIPVSYLTVDQDEKSIEQSVMKSLSGLVEKVYAPHSYRHLLVDRLRRFARIRNGIFTATVMVSLFFFLFISQEAIESFSMEQKLGDMKAALEVFQKKRVGLQDTLNLQYEAQSVIQAGKFAERVALDSSKAILGVELNEVGQVLNRHDHIALSQLVWHRVSKPGDEEIVVTLKGNAFPFKGRYQPVIDWVDSLLSDFQQQSYIHSAKLEHSPLANDGEGASVSIDKVGAEVKALPFSLELHLGSVSELH